MSEPKNKAEVHIGQVIRNGIVFNVKNWREGPMNTDWQRVYRKIKCQQKNNRSEDGYPKSQ